MLPHPFFDCGHRGPGKIGRADLHRRYPVERGNIAGQALWRFRQMFDPQCDNGGALPSPGPRRHNTAAANEVAELRHDTLRPGRRRVEAREVGGAVEDLRRFQLVENEEAIDVGAISAEHARCQEPLGRHALRGVLTCQPMTIVGQIGALDVAPDRKETGSAHHPLLPKHSTTPCNYALPLARKPCNGAGTVSGSLPSLCTAARIAAMYP